ncbi:hypothetical protein ACE1B6_03765 [Aerosakkonemataceae cyanobacterium BLCC-F154]|uniref:Uncharacterized protein n=1 Tax=Floridaenema fluviatile BLCC-F154 TaxID=3153640 RepID=A0ABV4Y778_9CYAN
MYTTEFDQKDTTSLNELIRFSSQAGESHSRSYRYLRKLNQTDNQVSKTTQITHAAPLSSLRERDLEALAEMFEPEDIAEVEADLIHYLNLMCPEPCWEEDPFDFLSDYL